MPRDAGDGDREPAPPSESKAERRARRRRRRRMLYAIVAVVVGVGVGLGGWAYWHFILYPPVGGTVSSGGPGGNNSSILPPPPQTILPGNTQFSLTPGQHQDTAFSLNRTCLVSGDFTADNAINVLVMTASEYHSWTGGGSLTSQWSSGVEKSGPIQAAVGAGDYYLVFLDPSSTTPAFVQVPGGVQAASI